MPAASQLSTFQTVVNNLVILEIKAAKALLAEHDAQLRNYLKPTSFQVGMLLNFGPTPQAKRKIYDIWRKKPGHGPTQTHTDLSEINGAQTKQ